MAYIYQIGFDLRPDQMDELKIGASLERVLGYLRTLLPSQDGFVTTRAMRSIDSEDKIHIVFESVWDRWLDFKSHRQSALAEDKILTEFAPHIDQRNLAIRQYEEID